MPVLYVFYVGIALIVGSNTNYLWEAETFGF